MSALNDLIEQFKDRPQDMVPAYQEALKLIKAREGNLKWLPNPGVQSEAYKCTADIIYYGGSGYGGKTDLGLGLAFNCHQRSFIVRRRFADLGYITDRAIEINGSRQGFRSKPHPRLTTDDGRIIDFGAANNVGDEQSRQGFPIDLLYVDEAAQFAESQIRFWMGWLRTNNPHQRVQVVFGSNPPLSEEGLWLFKMFAPWLDPTHPNPAKPGEIRWFIRDDDDNLISTPGPGRFVVVDGVAESSTEKDAVISESYTFIRAKADDNPYLTDEYRKKLDSLPPHLRPAIRDGDFGASLRDHDHQIISSEWIRLSQSKWTSSPPPVPQCAIGVDIAQGGEDKTVLAKRHDGWFDELVEFKGTETPDGLAVAGIVMVHRRDHSKVVIDLGGGYGGSAYEQLKRNIDTAVIGYKGSQATAKRTKDGSLPYFNTRAAAYYALREALDPDQPGGQRVILPPDPELFADFCSIRMDDKCPDNMIKLEPKKDLVKRIGRSTNKSDAVVMAWWDGKKVENSYHDWRDNMRGKPKIKVIMSNRRKRR